MKEFVNKAEAHIAQHKAQRLQGVKESDQEEWDEDAADFTEDWETPGGPDYRGNTPGDPAALRSDLLKLRSARGDLEYDPNDLSKYQKQLSRMKTQGGTNNSNLPRQSSGVQSKSSLRPNGNIGTDKNLLKPTLSLNKKSMRRLSFQMGSN